MAKKTKKVTTGKKKSKKWIGIVVALFVVFGLFGGSEDTATEDVNTETAIVEETDEEVKEIEEIVETVEEATTEEVIEEVVEETEDEEVISNLIEEPVEEVVEVDKSTPAPEPQPETVVVAESEPQLAPEPQQQSSNGGSGVTVPEHEETGANLVWVPTKGGTKYHSKSSCSGMEDPMQVTVETAIANNYEPCKRCH